MSINGADYLIHVEAESNVVVLIHCTYNINTTGHEHTHVATCRQLLKKCLVVMTAVLLRQIQQVLCSGQLYMCMHQQLLALDDCVHLQ